MVKERDNKAEETEIRLYSIYYKNKFIKQYPTKLQCIIYCMLKGKAYTGKGFTWLDSEISIKLDKG